MAIIPADNPLNVPSFEFTMTVPNFYWWDPRPVGNNYGQAYTVTGGVLYSARYNNNGQHRFLLASTSSDYLWTYGTTEDPTTLNPTRIILPSGSYTLDDKTVYYYTSNILGTPENTQSNAPYTDVNLYDSGIAGKSAWLMVYGGYYGYQVTYDLKNCTGDPDNPTAISPSATVTTAMFTADVDYHFIKVSCLIDGSGFPEGEPVFFVWNEETGELRIGPITSDITIHIKAYGDPYGPGGNSEDGGGDGAFDDESDQIYDSTLPPLSFADTGFTRIYNPTLSQLNSLANYMWTNNTFWQTVVDKLKQLIEDPMNSIISLALLPCSVPNTEPEEVKVMFIPTGVYMPRATTQFVDVDCGTLDVEEYYGSALDYNPYTKIHAYLPYIGQVTLDADEVMGKTLQVKYRIDIVTGMCAAKILVNQNVLYQFSGHCAINMPINSADFSSYIGAAITAGKMVAGVVAGAVGAPAVAAGLIGGPAPSSSIGTTQTNTDRRGPEGELRGFTDTTTVRTNQKAGMSMGEMSGRALSNTVSSVMSSKMTVEHAGGFSGNSGYLAVRRPYLIIERPRMCNPEEYGKYNGRPSMIYLNLGELAGYTEVQNIQLTGFTATNPEMAEIAQLLKSGVIL